MHTEQLVIYLLFFNPIYSLRLISVDAYNSSLFIFFFNLFLVGGYLLYNIVMVSAIHQHESGIGIHMFSPFWTSLLPPTPSHPLGCHRALYLSSLHDTTNFQWLSDCTHGNVYVSVLLSQSVPPSPFPTVSTSLFSMSASPSPSCW